MTAFIRTFQAEILKSKNTFAMWLAIAGAGLIPVILLIAYIAKWENFIPKNNGNPWNALFNTSFSAVSFFFIPMFVVLLNSLIFNIEHKSNTWKHIFVQPVSKTVIFFNKLLIVNGLTIICYTLFILFLLTFGMGLGLWKSQFGFLNHSLELVKVLTLAFKSYVSVLAVLSVHFWLGFRIKNVLLPVCIGLAATVTAGILAGRWKYTVFYPYAFPGYTIFKPDPNHFFADFQLHSLLYFVIFTGLAYWDFTKNFKG